MKKNNFIAILSPNRELLLDVLSEKEFDNQYPTYNDYKNIDCVWGFTKQEAEQTAYEIIDQAHGSD